jgi:phosphoserine phosphatase RsbU/P
MRILVVDDSEDSRDLTEGALLSAGYANVVTAGSGWEAMKVLDIGRNTEERPAIDVVLLDIVMPDMDGVEACARIRNDARYGDLPIIMVTSLDDMGSLSNAFVAGATDYVTKPVNRVELVARVRAALKLKQELDRRQSRERELLSFLSNWGDRRASVWIDEATGLLTGEWVKPISPRRAGRTARAWFRFSRSGSTASRPIARRAATRHRATRWRESRARYAGRRRRSVLSLRPIRTG